MLILEAHQAQTQLEEANEGPKIISPLVVLLRPVTMYRFLLTAFFSWHFP